jgi:hypothetical protein
VHDDAIRLEVKGKHYYYKIRKHELHNACAALAPSEENCFWGGKPGLATETTVYRLASKSCKEANQQYKVRKGIN